MSYMARWGSKGFLVSPTKIVALEDLKTSITLKSDSENDTSGTSPTNTRGLLLQPVSFSVTYIRAAGTDPRAQLEEWQSLVGQSNPLYIGNKRFGPNSLILKQVDAADFVFSPKGDILSVTVNISLEEESEGKTSKLTESTAKKSGASASVSTSSSASRAASTYAATVAKRKAMNATASAADKKRLLRSGESHLLN